MAKFKIEDLTKLIDKAIEDKLKLSNPKKKSEDEPDEKDYKQLYEEQKAAYDKLQKEIETKEDDIELDDEEAAKLVEQAGR